MAKIRFVTPGNVLTERLDAEMVLLNLDSERYFALDDVGTQMVQALVECQDVDAAVARLLRHYAVAEATLRNDLTALVHDLEKAGLIEVQRDDP